MMGGKPVGNRTDEEHKSQGRSVERGWGQKKNTKRIQDGVCMSKIFLKGDCKNWGGEGKTTGRGSGGQGNGCSSKIGRPQGGEKSGGKPRERSSWRTDMIGGPTSQKKGGGLKEKDKPNAA